MKLKVNDTFPDFTFNTHVRDNVEVKDILKGKTVFWVIRYIGCPVCRWDVHSIAEHYDAFKKENAQVFVVMQSDRKHILDSLNGEVLPFEIITDTEMNIYKTLEINPALNEDDLCKDTDPRKEAIKHEGCVANGFKHGDYEGDELQLPAMFIVNEKGIVTYAKYGKNYLDLPLWDEVVELVKD